MPGYFQAVALDLDGTLAGGEQGVSRRSWTFV